MHGVFLAFKDPGHGFALLHFRSNGALLDHGALRGKVTVQDGDAPLMGIRGFQSMDDAFVHDAGIKLRDIFCLRTPGHGER